MWNYIKLNGRTMRIKTIKYRRKKRAVKMRLAVDNYQLARVACSAMRDTPPDILSCN